MAPEPLTPKSLDRRRRAALAERLRAQGVPPIEIQRQLSALGEAQSIERRITRLRAALEAEGHPASLIDERVELARRRLPLPATTPPVPKVRAARGPRQCFRGDGKAKHVYPTRGAATAATRHIQPYRTPHVDAYRCQFCDGWHVGHRRSRRTARKVLK